MMSKLGGRFGDECDDERVEVELDFLRRVGGCRRRVGVVVVGGDI